MEETANGGEYYYETYHESLGKLETMEMAKIVEDEAVDADRRDWWWWWWWWWR